ncbi:MAG: hypothetical protein RDU25_00515 [Patescibacteria group bacterium]|nr:hypothetical protein [Patescibacteria group bacterium]
MNSFIVLRAMVQRTNGAIEVEYRVAVEGSMAYFSNTGDEVKVLAVHALVIQAPDAATARILAGKKLLPVTIY